MPIITVMMREGILEDSEMKAVLIAELSAAFARAMGDDIYRKRSTVVILEVPDDNWGRAGRQHGS
jgi:phenylpyruvate tautomerase PptA (4-oxalocrotonate tautomerase family)